MWSKVSNLFNNVLSCIISLCNCYITVYYSLNQVHLHLQSAHVTVSHHYLKLKVYSELLWLLSLHIPHRNMVRTICKHCTQSSFWPHNNTWQYMMVYDDYYNLIGIKSCSQEITTSVLATTLVFATIIIFILVVFLCVQHCRRKSQPCSSSI